MIIWLAKHIPVLCAILAVAASFHPSDALSLLESTPSRRAFVTKCATVVTVGSLGLGSNARISVAAPEIITTENGIKYAVLKEPTLKGRPRDKDIVAIEYTGYLTDGTIFGTCRAGFQRTQYAPSQLLYLYCFRFDACRRKEGTLESQYSV
jgi:hypothetical protein